MTPIGWPDWQSAVQSRPASLVDDTRALVAGGTQDYLLGQQGSWPSLLLDMEVTSGGATLEIEHDYAPGTSVPYLIDAYVIVSGQRAVWIVPNLAAGTKIHVLADATSGCAYQLEVTQVGTQVAGPDPATRGGNATWDGVSIPANGNTLKVIPFCAGGPATFFVQPGPASTNIVAYVQTLTTASTGSNTIMGLNDNPTGERVMTGNLPIGALGIAIFNTSTTTTETVTVSVTMAGGGPSG